MIRVVSMRLVRIRLPGSRGAGPRGRFVGMAHWHGSGRRAAVTLGGHSVTEVDTSQSFASAPSDRKHGVLPARSGLTGRRSVRVGSRQGCRHGGLGGLELRRSYQVGTDLAEKRSGRQVAP